MRGGDEAAGDRHLDDRRIRLDEQVAGAVEPDLQIVARRRAAEIAPEQALDLAPRQARILGDLDQRQRLGDVGFHQLDDEEQLGVLQAEPGAERQPLAVGRRAHAVGQRLLADLRDDLLVEMLADQVQHHVERGGAAGAGVAIAVDLEEVGIDLRLRKALREGRQRFPVDGAAAAFQDAGVGEHPGAGIERADADLLAVERGDPGVEVAVVETLDAERAADEDVVGPLAAAHPLARLLERHVDDELDAVRCRGRLAVERDERPAIGLLARHAVGDPERLDGSREGDHGEVRDEHEVEVPFPRCVCLARCASAPVRFRSRPCRIWSNRTYREKR